MKKIIPFIIVLVVAIGGSFFGGMKYGESKSLVGKFAGGNFQGEAMQNGGEPSSSTGATMRSGNILSGEIINLDDESLTLQTQDGSSKIVLFSDSTEVSKTTTGSANDLEAGKTVMVSGTQNSDGSYTAKTIQVR
jgi:hypothetical protein